jgi:hypothetical protein
MNEKHFFIVVRTLQGKRNKSFGTVPFRTKDAALVADTFFACGANFSNRFF